MRRLEDTLNHYWGYSSFRPMQKEIITSVLDGKDTLALMPTGGGKSITFQVPGLLLEGVCLVVTPLIALMKDQVDNLRARGIKATTIYSGMSSEEARTALNNTLYGGYKFLYVSPERLTTDLFRSYLTRANLSMIVIDEAHCISQWGYDFRPSYLRIAEVRQLYPQLPILALTATATPTVVKDIQEKLCFRTENVLQNSFKRENLSYVVRNVKDKNPELLNILHKVKGSAIVYTRSRAKTKEIAQLLTSEGIAADYYHAGLPRGEKEKRQNEWKSGRCRVMVSTNAFGMGIDKSDVRVVVHIDTPDSLEEYFQEAGRVGRDGLRAYAVLLANPYEKRNLVRRLTDRFPDKEFIREVYDILGSYLKVALHSGKERTFEFDAEKFAFHYKYSPFLTVNAFKILTDAGYVFYNDEPNNRSRVMFTIIRDELYRMRELSAKQELLIQYLLRNYTGLFADYAFISEETLALQTKQTRQEVYDGLIILQKHHIIKYIPASNHPTLTYTRQRENKEDVAIKAPVYEDKKERYETKINAVLDYILLPDVCRSTTLLNYFGEKAEEVCGCCDVCIANRKRSFSHTDKENIRTEVKRLVESGTDSVIEICKLIAYPMAEVMKVLRVMKDEGEIDLQIPQ